MLRVVIRNGNPPVSIDVGLVILRRIVTSLDEHLVIESCSTYLGVSAELRVRTPSKCIAWKFL